MNETEYLYGCQPEAFADMAYRKAIKYKLKQAKSLKADLIMQEELFYQQGGDYDGALPIRDRLRAVEKAVRHNQKLIEELIT